MQMYKGLPIITNKVTPAEAQGIPHHLLDCVSLSKRPWNVSNFTSECLKVLEDIRSRGKLPILVGGTHYYTHALLFKNALVNVGDQGGEGERGEGHVTAEEKEAKWPILRASGEELYAKLKEVDPVMARRWHPKDTRKVRRSIEIWLETGRPASEIYEEQKTRNPIDGHDTDGSSASKLRYPSLVFWIRSQNDVLKLRLDRRVDQMMENGMLREVEQLSTMAAEEEERGVLVDRTSGIWASIGFKEVQPFVLAKRADVSMSMLEEEKLKQEAIELTKIATRQYAGRQEKWVKYRFMDSMEAAGESHRVFPMDSTDVEEWEQEVKDPAESIAAAFLAGATLPDPKKSSIMAGELLTDLARERDINRRKRTREAHHCEICDKILMTRGEWEAHLRSTKHKKTVRYLATIKGPPP